MIFFGIKPNSNKYDFFLSNTERDRAKSFVSSMGDKIKIGINIEGSFLEKSIQKKELEEICSGLYSHCRDIVIVILASPNKISNHEKNDIRVGSRFCYSFLYY